MPAAPQPSLHVFVVAALGGRDREQEALPPVEETGAKYVEAQERPEAMQNAAAKVDASALRDPASDDHALVHEIVGEFCSVTPEQPQHVIGIPCRIAHLATAKSRKPRNLVSLCRRRRNGSLDGGGERRRDPLVGIDRKHPIPARKTQGKILLRAAPLPIVMLDARAF